MTIKKVMILLVLCLWALSAAVGQHAASNSTAKLNIAAIEKMLGMKEQESKGEYKITVPQHDLNVDVDDLKIILPMGMGSSVGLLSARPPKEPC